MTPCAHRSLGRRSNTVHYNLPSFVLQCQAAENKKNKLEKIQEMTQRRPPQYFLDKIKEGHWTLGDFLYKLQHALCTEGFR